MLPRGQRTLVSAIPVASSNSSVKLLEGLKGRAPRDVWRE